MVNLQELLFARSESPVLEVSNQGVSDVLSKQHGEFINAESDHSPQSNAEIKNALVFTFTFRQVFVGDA
jgi:hypothetical protein